MERGRLRAEFTSSQGVRQGDGLGSLLFSLSMKTTYSECIQGLECHAVAVIDDFYLLGRQDQAFAAFDRFTPSLPNLNLTLSLPKCNVLLTDNPAADLITNCTTRNLPHSTTSISALGSIVSRNPDLISKWLNDQVSTLHQPYFTMLLDSRLPTQHAFILLRSCMVPRMNFWSRTTAPSIFAPAARTFDDLVVDTFTKRMKLPALTDVARSQLSLPVGAGGFGLSSLVIVSPAAWYSALAQAFSSIRPFITSLDTLRNNIPFVKSLSQCMTYFSHYTFPRGSPVSASVAQFWMDHEAKRRPAGAQRLIMAVIYKSRAAGIIKKFARNSTDRARLASVSTPYSGSWLTTTPIDPIFTLPDVHFALSCRLRLGITFFDDIRHCICGASLIQSPLHFMSCTRLNAVRIIRHDRIVQVIARVARTCGVVVHLEPRIDEEDKSRGDGHLYFHTQSAIYDTYVIDPCANTYVKTAQQPLGASATGEAKKISHYGVRCKEQGFLFFPVVLETFGGIGVRCRDLVGMIEEEGSLNGVKNIHGMPIKAYLLRALSVTLQSGNAHLAIHGSQRSRKRLR